MKYYSPTTNGFYDSNDFYLYEAAGTMPTDLVEITEDTYIELRSDIEAGRQFLKFRFPGEVLSYRAIPVVVKLETQLLAFIIDAEFELVKDMPVLSVQLK